jgi:uncharacterized membrane protein YbhN (UPF0104 family)
MPERPPVTLHARPALLAVGLAALLGGGALALLGQAAHIGRLQRAAQVADVRWLAPCLAGQLLAYLGYVLAYHDAARADGGPRFDYRTTAQIVVFGAGAAVLSASVAGLAVDYWALRRTGTAARVAARRVLAVGTIEWTVLSMYAWIAAALVLVTGARAPRGMAIAWLCAVPVAVAAGRWFTAPRRVRRFVDFRPAPPPAGRGRPARIAFAAEQRIRAGLADAIAGVVFVRHLLSHPRRYLGGTIGYPIYWAGDMLTLYAAIRGFGIAIPVVPLVLAYATSFVISALPLPAGGAGGVEAAITLAVHGIGVPLAEAVLAVLVYRLVTFWLPVLPAVLLLPRIRRLHATLPKVPHTPRDHDEGVSFRPSTSAVGTLTTDGDGPMGPGQSVAVTVRPETEPGDFRAGARSERGAAAERGTREVRDGAQPADDDSPEFSRGQPLDDPQPSARRRQDLQDEADADPGGADF